MHAGTQTSDETQQQSTQSSHPLFTADFRKKKIPSLHNELLANRRISTNHTALLEIQTAHDKFGKPCREPFEEGRQI